MVSDFFIMLLSHLASTVILATGTAQGDGTYQSFLTPPDWFMDLGGPAGEVFQAANSMSVWFPWQFVIGVVLAVFGAFLAGFGIKVARILISLFTGGGGNA